MIAKLHYMSNTPNCFFADRDVFGDEVCYVLHNYVTGHVIYSNSPLFLHDVVSESPGERSTVSECVDALTTVILQAFHVELYQNAVSKHDKSRSEEQSFYVHPTEKKPSQ